METDPTKILTTLEVTGADGLLHAVPVEISFSGRARRISLRVPRIGPVRLVVPAILTADKGIAFFHTQHNWILQALSRREKLGRTALPPAESMEEFFTKYPRLTAAGETYALECGATAGRPFLVYRRGENPVVFRTRSDERRERELQALTRTFAESVIPARVMELAARIGIPVARVSVRNQCRRWGSCAGTGVISLNWRLVLLPPELHDYVIWHELAHRLEMNHSDRFWSQLAQWDSRAGWHDRDLNKEWGWLMHLAR